MRIRSKAAIVGAAMLVAASCAFPTPPGAGGGAPQTTPGGASAQSPPGGPGAQSAPATLPGNISVPPNVPQDAMDQALGARDEAVRKQIESVSLAYLVQNGLPGDHVVVDTLDLKAGSATAHTTGGPTVTLQLKAGPDGQWEVGSHSGP